MEERLEAILKRFNEIKEELMDSSVMQDFKKVSKLSKEQSDLEEIVNKYEEYREIKNNITEAKSLINDSELHEMAELELEELNNKFEQINKDLEILLIPKDESDGKMLLWKYVVLQVEMKQIFLLEIYLECIHIMQKKIIGK